MTLYNRSRGLKVETIEIEAADGDKQQVYKLGQTSVQEFDIDSFEWYTVKGAELFEDIADKFYEDIGGADLFWVLAMCNDHIFYPLDIQAGDRIRVPSPQWVEEFVNQEDAWESTWRNVVRV
jgi:hypothetical protein